MEKSTKSKRLKIFVTNPNVVLPESSFSMDLVGEFNVGAITDCVKNDEEVIIAYSDNSPVGVICSIKSSLPNGDGIKIAVAALKRAKIEKAEVGDHGVLTGIAKPVTCSNIGSFHVASRVRQVFYDIIKIDVRYGNVKLSSDPAVMCDFVANLVVKHPEDRLMMLNELILENRLLLLEELLRDELASLSIMRDVSGKVKQNVDKHQRDYFLREQLKVIGEELGDDDSEIVEISKKIEESKMPEEIDRRAKKELRRLEKLNPMSPELTVLRNYLDNLVEVPWNKDTTDELDLKKAREVLDGDHYGMLDVKDRIIEHLAVMQLNKKLTGQILCFVGPPGVGKTSIVESIAKSLGRKFVRVSLGGVKDESEIRGHRKTYIGAMPGKVIAGMKKAGTINPVFLFDEIDKMSSDHKGDPASAMLEVLDPVQNKTFTDHYMEVPYDLSRVLFICTANDESSIPWALADRLEVINLSSYMLVEKIKIAKQFLLPKNEIEHGLKKGKIKVDDKVWAFIIENYTREAGVRELSRVICNLCRKIALKVVNCEITAAEGVKLTRDMVVALIGKEKYTKDDLDKKSCVGVVNGLSYTSVGGDVLKLEVVLTPATGKNGELKLTGRLGEVMKESAQLALSITKSLAADYGIDAEAFKKNDIHIHVPGGAVPKDGPSAGVALVVALISAFSGKKVRGDFALTGEITLSGRVLEIGGVKEKVLSAYRYGIDNVIMPTQNEKSLEKVPAEVKDKLNFIFAGNIREVLGNMLQ